MANQKKPEPPKPRNVVVQNMIERNQSGGSHKNRDRDVEKGRSRKQKHKKPLLAGSDLQAMAARIAAKWVGEIPHDRLPANVRTLKPGESSSQEAPAVPLALQDVKERDDTSDDRDTA